MKKVLITGASGFIGRHTIQNLLNRGFEVHAVSRRKLSSLEGVYWQQADLFNSVQMENIIDKIKPTHLLHFAWNVEPKTYMSNIDNFQWVRASLQLLEIFQKKGGIRVVCAGTCAEYDWRCGYLSETVTPCTPVSNYGFCKNSLYGLMHAFCLSTNISFSWGRAFFLYGPHEDESRLVAYIIKSLLYNQPAKCTNGEQYRDFLYVEDAADAFCELLNSSVIGAINIGSGKPLLIRQLAQLIAEKMDKPGLLQLGAIKSRHGDPGLLVADTTKLSNELNWNPKYTIDAGIEKTIYWWRNYLNK